MRERKRVKKRSLNNVTRLSAAASAWALVGTCLAQFTALPTINVNGTGQAPTESAGNNGDYVPNVVLCENGLASFEALKAQAVAARTFAYYKMDLNGSINDGTSDQVYSCSGNPLAIHHEAARATEGEILYVFDSVAPGFGDVLIASFYVAGAIPSGPFDPADPSAIPNPGDPDPTNTQRWVTYPYEDGVSGGNNLGTPLGFQGTPSNPNWPNRGAKSQNGADFLSDNSISYVDILKYFYGADIQLRTATTEGTSVEFGLKTLTDFDNYGDRFGNTFDGHEGYFGRSPTFSGSTTANVAGSTAERSAAEALSGTHSQLLDIVYDESSGNDFLVRHLSGARFSDFGGSQNAAARVSNLQFESIGSVGFWLKTDVAGLEASIALDDPTTGDRGVLKPVVADGQWHKYEWFLDEASQWEAWIAAGDGVISGVNVSLDSIQLFGASDAQVYLDDVFWNPQADFVPSLPGDFNEDGAVDGQDLGLWEAGYATPSGAGVGDGDADEDGGVDGDDFKIWQRNLGVGASLRAVPEPSAALVAIVLLAGVAGRRRRSVMRLAEENLRKK